MSKEILCTLGPSSLNDSVISRLEELGVSLFRLNLSHTKISDLARIVEYVHSRTTVPLCLDTEGAQIRTGTLIDGKVWLRENSTVCICRQLVPGDANRINLYPNYILEDCRLGDFISLDSAVLAQVIETDPDQLVIRILHGGEVGSNKAVTVHRDIPMPPLTEKDQKAMAIARTMGIRHLALSFANRASDVDAIRGSFGKDAFVFSKIECRNALTNLAEIASKSDALLIDRGDLSRDVPIEQIPAVQKHIIARAKETGRKVYVATNLMESMVTSAAPTRAEVNDVYNTLADGADGLVLAAESAIGKYPIGCASMVVKIIREFENGSQKTQSYSRTPAISLLVDPHGGTLVDREAKAEISGLDELRSLTLRHIDLMDCRQIASGGYSPLTGFMGREELESVLNNHRLPSGLPWPMPIVLQVEKESVAGLGGGELVALKSQSGKIHAVLDIGEVYSFDLEEMSKKWFGTTSVSHPGVARLMNGGNSFVSGSITLIQDIKFPFSGYELTPTEARFVFAQKGWHKVVGFHSRNVPHRGHEFIQKQALESTHADGLLISPVIGPRDNGDFQPELVTKSYQLMVDFGIYPRGKVVLGCFATYPRYSGPREAVFTALCLKNMGCSDFIIGREQFGFRDLYKHSDVRDLFEELGDIGVTPLFCDPVGYSPTKHAYCSLGSGDALPIRGSEIRAALRAGRELPEWAMRDIVRDMITAEVASGRDVA